MTKLYVLDTNAALNYPQVIDTYDIVVTSHLLRELEKIESNKDKYGERSFQAREVRRKLKANKDKLYLDLKDYSWKENNDYDNYYEDNRILQSCIDNNYGIITCDGLLAEKAQLFGVEWLDIENALNNNEDKYSGFKEIKMSWIQYKEFEEGLMTGKNPYGLLQNEYIVIEYTDEHETIKTALRWDSQYYHQLAGKKSLKTKMFGDFKPLDIYQKIAIDSLSNNQLTMIKGKAGTGKSMIALNYSMQQLENGKVDKIIFFVNPAPTRNSVQLGFYKGTKDEKLLDSSVGNMLSSKFGDKTYIEGMIERNEILLLPFSDIRGFDTSSDKQKYIVHILESQNLNVDLMKLAIQRIGSNTKLIIDGDFSAQVDSTAYEGIKNGMRRTSEVFRGTEYYGEVELQNIYRSELAKRAELM
jgi:predicted ribonuclease YlaK